MPSGKESIHGARLRRGLLPEPALDLGTGFWFPMPQVVLCLGLVLREELRRVGPIELFACWDGDQGAAPEHRRTLHPAAFETDDFELLEKELSILSLDAT